MKKTRILVCLLLAVGRGCLANTQTFVNVKKTISEKPSQIKQEIVDVLESVLTSTSDLIVSIAQEQTVLIQKVRDVAQSQGAFAQTNPQALKKYRDALKKMEKDLMQQTQLIQNQFAVLKKDFSERI